MRVLYVDNSYGQMGGSLVSLLQLTRQLVARGEMLPANERIEPYFYFLYPPLLLDEFRQVGPVFLEREDYAEFGTPIGVPKPLAAALARLPWTANRVLCEILPLAVRVARHARRIGADLIHCNCRLGSNEYAILGGMLAGIPVVGHERLIYKLTPLTKIFAKAVDRIIAVSRSVAENLEKQGVSHPLLSVLYNGIDTSELARYREGEKEPDAPLRIGMVGRITHSKGQHILVEVARRLIAQGMDVEFHFAGESLPSETEYLEALVSTVQDADMEARVVFHGNVKAIYEFISSMDILVHCSLEPGALDRVVQEAMALAKPTIATRGGGVEEICTNGHDALVVDPGRPDQLAAAITRLHNEPETAAVLARNALQTIETRFSLERAARRVRTFYKEVALTHRRHPVLGTVTEFLASSPFSVRRAKPAQIARKTN